MGDYFVLECYGPPDADRAAIGEIVNAPRVNWNLGAPFEVEIAEPIEVRLDPDQPGVLVPMFERTILLMRDDMIDIMRAAGVDNLQTYDAVLVDPATGTRHRNYKAVNIVGLIGAADRKESVIDAHGGDPLIDADVESLVVDPNLAAGHLCFRLAECVSAKLVHRRVREALEGRVPHLDFVPPEEWSG